ncbi:Hsp20/alpha crystallin family protein [Methylobacterium sp. B4]|uniref:Hsp20/alpha crystallin family protein n=1 Tax=Methylobacterium sp. B4 TaxID=1938755 RepID=UPI000D76826A|nr:Hsp20/alpha crystallin family protein [Methylobacterium sp. B4]PXW61448.1 HSP20 family protein [Methylobacterium sp. B4]
MNLRSLLTLGDRFNGTSANGRSVMLPLQRGADAIFGDLRSGLPQLLQDMAVPRMDVVEKDGHLEVTAELPGLTRDDVKIELADDTLIISGEKRQENLSKDSRKIIERSYGAFVRSLELPAGIKAEDIEASIDKGVLTVKLPMAAMKPTEAKRIEIKAS